MDELTDLSLDTACQVGDTSVIYGSRQPTEL